MYIYIYIYMYLCVKFAAVKNMQQASSMVITILYFILASSSSSSSSSFPIAKHNCIDRCGDIAIPFPFGTTPECYQHASFFLTCNHTHFDPPKLFFLNSTSIQVTHISLHGQMRLMQLIGIDCYDGNATVAPATFTTHPSIELPTHLTFNNTANKFTIVGCDTFAFITGYRLLESRDYWAGCSAWCNAEADLTDGACSGLGCCQTTIPKDVWQVEVQLSSYANYSSVWEFNKCGFAFLVEEASFNFTKDQLTSLLDVETLPVVVDWAVGNGTCEEAEANATGYACVSPNSGCFKPDNGYGYRCRCDQGYEGNPYLSHGCIDVDECADETRNDCMKKEYCVNVEGNYSCLCPKGYTGDGYGEEGCMPAPSKKIDMKIVYSLIGTAFVITALLLAAALLHLELKRRSHTKMKHKFFLQNGGFLLQQKLDRGETSQQMVKIFRSSELQKATNDFHNTMIVGQGGFGTVYKGFLPDNRVVAIKKSKRLDPNESEQFINEVLVLSQINHRNVVRLLGCCLETEVPLLVYEFISNGTLSAHIHNEAKARFLKWETRLKIAAETASVLAYLHSAASTTIIHRDVKPDNILLDHTFTAKVSDFGASKLVPLDLTQLSTMVQGTLGYLDPEYMQTNKLTEKSDVYSFGVVLLELVTGRKALSFNRPVEEKNLAHYVLSILEQDRLFEIVDDNILGLENMEQICEVARVAKECLNMRGVDRPSMKEVAMELEGMIVSGKHSWSRNADNANEMESLLVKDEHDQGLNHFVINGEGNSSSVGYDSIRDRVHSPMILSGGR